MTPSADSALKDRVDVIVLGGGAAGMFCAMTAAGRGRSVLLLEHNETPGRKIEISGGGRCNFTNIHASPENYISGNKDFCRSALARFTPGDFLSLVESRGIPYHEKKLGQQFCDGSSRQIIAMLSDECEATGVTTLCGCGVEHVEKTGDGFTVATSRGILKSRTLVVATGGLSFPKLGASDLGYRIARQFGIGVTHLRPGLVPLTHTPADKEFFACLAGISLPVRVEKGGRRFEEAMLFTHRGVSGPAILQISSYWKEGEELSFDLLPAPGAHEEVIEARASGSTPLQVLSRRWPRRFAEAWCERHAPRRPLARCSKVEIESFQENLRAWKPSFAGTEGYPKAEVTLGGVDTGELSSTSMEARSVPGLYFIGEVVDVTGWLGGYNFQWAWASAHAAGTAI
jgi:predicted Rossmann fold flavoprotein